MPQGKLSSTLALQRHGLAALQCNACPEQPSNKADAETQATAFPQLEQPISSLQLEQLYCAASINTIENVSVILTPDWETQTPVMRAAGGCLTWKSSAVRFSRQIRHMGCVPLPERFKMALSARPRLPLLRRPNRLSKWAAALLLSGLLPACRSSAASCAQPDSLHCAS